MHFATAMQRANYAVVRQAKDSITLKNVEEMHADHNCIPRADARHPFQIRADTPSISNEGSLNCLLISKQIKFQSLLSGWTLLPES